MLLKLLGALTHLGDDFTVGERLESVVDMATLLVLPHETFRTVEETFLNLDQRELLLVPAIELFDQTVHHWFVRDGFLERFASIHVK